MAENEGIEGIMRPGRRLHATMGGEQTEVCAGGLRWRAVIKHRAERKPTPMLRGRSAIPELGPEVVAGRIDGMWPRLV